MSPNPDPPRPRKSASTAAGSAIIDAILDAAEALIEEDGLERFTTNRVGERAGVSVGSLYQYFPNKQAILAELGRRLERRTQTRLVELLEETGAAPIGEVATRVVDLLLGGLGGLRFRSVLQQAVPTGWTLDTTSEIDAQIRDRVEAELSRRDDVRAGPYPLMAWVVSHAVEGVIEAVVRTDPHLLEAPAFRAELIELVTRYLTR
jgi:AcrR family transcriptional regulator